jgi:hypothetical protein
VSVDARKQVGPTEAMDGTVPAQLFSGRLEVVPGLNEVYELELAFCESKVLSDSEIVRNGAYFASVGGVPTHHFLMRQGLALICDLISLSIITLSWGASSPTMAVLATVLAGLGMLFSGASLVFNRGGPLAMFSAIDAGLSIRAFAGSAYVLGKDLN